MKLLKRCSAIMMAATLLPTLGTIHASAYDVCDVNHDGYVDVSDAVYISRYLAGDLYEPNYNIFDTNKSLTVDELDEEYVYAKMLQQSYSAKYYNRQTQFGVTFPTVSGFTPDAYASSTSSRAYTIYNYNTQQISQYALLPPTSSMSTSKISNPTRVHYGNVDLHASTSGDAYGMFQVGSGIGFVVGDHIIATAAHVVYEKGNNSFVSNVTVKAYTTTGTLSSNTYTPLEVHIPSNYITADEDTEYEFDYALIKVSENLEGHTYFKLGTTYNVSASNYSIIPIYVTGPGYVGNSNSNSYYDLYYSQGNLLDLSGYGSILAYDADTDFGWSGSPVYTITKMTINNQTTFEYTAIAIHSSGSPSFGNMGSRITKYHLQFYSAADNPYI